MRPPAPGRRPALAGDSATDVPALTAPACGATLARMPRHLMLVVVFVLSAAAPTVRAGDLTVFVGAPSPADNWGRAYGGTLSSTWFTALALEGELARYPEEHELGSMTTLTGAALLAPSLGVVTPYGGLGIGLYRQSFGNDAENGVVRALIVGVKAQVGLAVVKAEFRSITLSGTPLIDLERRFSLGAGITF